MTAPMSVLIAALRLTLALLALAALGCQAEPETLSPGQCRTDVDCPGGERCVIEPAQTIGRCGCFEDSHCAGTQRCDREARRCGCADDGQCPAGLVCREGRCLCESDVQCDGLPCESGADCPDGRCDAARGVCHSADPDDLPACVCASGGICAHDGGGPYDPARAPTCNVDARSTQNACGGRGPLVPIDCGEDAECAAGPVEAGATCGAGGWGRWTCSGCDSPPRCCRPDAAARLGLDACCRPDAGRRACEALMAERPATRDGRAVCCPPDHVLDPCGACIGPDDDRFAALVAAVDGGATVGDPCRSDQPGAAPAGVWRCEDAGDGPRAVCVACAAGTPPNACGGCEALVRISAVDDAAPIEADDVGRPCGGDGEGYGFRTACPGVLTCIDARQIACEAPVPGRRCPNHCGEVEVARARDAGGGVCLLDALVPGDDACRTLGEIAGAPSRAGDEGASAGNLDALRDGEPCGPCGDGRWTCEEGDGRPRLTCDGADEAPPLNICGQCGGPPVLQAGVVLLDPACVDPGCECRIGGDVTQRGELECDAGGLSLLVCVTGAVNACGGLGVLDPPTAVPGARCGPASAGSANRCDTWFWQCSGVDRIVCVDRADPAGGEAQLNRCGGCAPLSSDFRGEGCPGLVGVQPVCLADLSGEVCIYRDGQLPNTADADGRCNCVRREADTGAETIVYEQCRYLVDSDADGTLDRELRCDDPEPNVDNCGVRGATCCTTVGVPPCSTPRTLCAYDLEALGERCVDCGADGQACCPDAPGQNRCDGGLRCAPDVQQCEPCGGVDEPCCDGAICDAGGVCGADDTCVPCGGVGDPCCAGRQCDADGACDVGRDLCVACGGVGDPCCADDVCDDDATCTGNTCRACGGVGEPCCAGQQCDANAICEANACLACGAAGQPCCADQTCRGGTACVDDVCEAPDPDPEPDAGPDAAP